MKYLLLLSLFVPSLAHSQVLVPWGEAQENHQIYGLLAEESDDLYDKNFTNFQTYIDIPFETSVRARINSEGTRLRLEIGLISSTSGEEADLGLQISRGLQPKPFDFLGSKATIEFTEEFKSLLEEWIKNHPNAKITLDRWDGQHLYSASQSLRTLGVDTLEKAFTNLYRLAASRSKLFNVYIDLPKPESLDADRLVGMTLLRIVVPQIVHTPVDKVQAAWLPAVEDLEFASASFTRQSRFYEAYRLLDENLFEAMNKAGALETLRLYPERQWRRLLLEEAFKEYFSDSESSRSNTCQAYEVRALRSSGSTWIELPLIDLERSDLVIPQKVLTIDSL